MNVSVFPCAHHAFMKLFGEFVDDCADAVEVHCAVGVIVHFLLYVSEFVAVNFVVGEGLPIVF